MAQGKIIFLNGVTSSGKTSIVDALQSDRDRLLYVVANDLFQETVGESWLREDYWKYLSEAIIMMYRTARLYSECGKDIIIDGILVERAELAPHYERMREILKGCPLYIVEVYCPLDICKERNIARGDRYETQSEEQARIMAQGIDYCMRVDTSVLSSEECARQIMQTVF